MRHGRAVPETHHQAVLWAHTGAKNGDPLTAAGAWTSGNVDDFVAYVLEQAKANGSPAPYIEISGLGGQVVCVYDPEPFV